jgi:hypothetical protein
MIETKTIFTITILILLFLYLTITKNHSINKITYNNVLVTKVNKRNTLPVNNNFQLNNIINPLEENFQESNSANYNSSLQQIPGTEPMAGKQQASKTQQVITQQASKTQQLPLEQQITVPKCSHSGDNLFFVFLNVENLMNEAYRPVPEWTNEIFCAYKAKPILSLNDSITDGSEDDKYYPLGDIILIKDYPTYLANYPNNLEQYCYQGGNGLNNMNTTNTTNTPIPKNNIENFTSPSESENNNFILPADSNISNYDQPGVHGLRILVKNGRKPVGFKPDPVTKIEKSNGQILWVWEPIAPEGYVFLGHVFSVGVTPSVPLIERCNIRSIPKDCVKDLELSNRNILISEDLILPNRIYLTSNNKYFKGYTVGNNENELNLKSHDISQNCIKFERDQNDNIMHFTLQFETYNREGENNILQSHVYETIKNNFHNKIENILLENLVFKLNNYTNRPDNSLFITDDKRYTLESFSLVNNKVTLKIKMKQRALAYDEILGSQYSEIFSSNKNLFIFSMNVSGIQYHFRIIENSEVETEVDPTTNGGSGLDFGQPIDPRLSQDKNEIDSIVNASEQFPDADPFNETHSFNRFVDVLTLLNEGVPSISPVPSTTQPSSS